MFGRHVYKYNADKDSFFLLMQSKLQTLKISAMQTAKNVQWAFRIQLFDFSPFPTNFTKIVLLDVHDFVQIFEPIFPASGETLISV